MAVPTDNTHVTQKQAVAVPLVQEKAERCPQCNGTGWVKVFTPWGCPSGAPCDGCSPADSARPTKPVK